MTCLAGEREKEMWKFTSNWNEETEFPPFPLDIQVHRSYAARYFHILVRWKRCGACGCVERLLSITLTITWAHLGQISAGGIIGLGMHFMICCLVAIVTQTQPNDVILNFNANSHGYEHVICSFLRNVLDARSGFFRLEMSVRQKPHRIWRKKSIQWNPRAVSAYELREIGRRAQQCGAKCNMWKLIYFYIKSPFGLCARRLPGMIRVIFVAASDRQSPCEFARRHRGLCICMAFAIIIRMQREAVEWVLLFIWFLTLAFISPARLHIVNENYSLRLFGEWCAMRQMWI